MASQANAPRRSSARPISFCFELEPRLEKQEHEAEFREEFDRVVVCDQSHHTGADQHAKNEFEPDHGHEGESGETNEQRRENRHAGNREDAGELVHQALLGSIVCFAMDRSKTA